MYFDQCMLIEARKLDRAMPGRPWFIRVSKCSLGRSRRWPAGLGNIAQVLMYGKVSTPDPGLKPLYNLYSEVNHNNCDLIKDPSVLV